MNGKRYVACTRNADNLTPLNGIYSAYRYVCMCMTTFYV